MKVRPERLGDYEFYQVFDDLEVTVDDFLDYINHCKTERTKKMFIRNGFESCKDMEPFKEYVLNKAGFFIEDFRKRYAIF